MISILLSCYKSNRDFLIEQIVSILHQTEKDWELLVYNDGADCFNEIKAFFDDRRIKYFDEGHKGYVSAFNYLFERAKGEYICICDHDDVWESNKLEVEKEYLDNWHDVDCVFSWLKWFGEKKKLESFSIEDDVISKELYFYQPIKNPTVMFRKDRFGLNDCPFEKASDFWYWAKYKDRHYHLIEKYLVNYRRHSGEMTKDKSGFREGSALVIQKNLKERFGVTLHIDVCKMLDPYSKTYNDLMKAVIATLINGKD